MRLDSAQKSCDPSSTRDPSLSRDRQGAGGPPSSAHAGAGGESDPQPLLERLQRASRVPLGVHLQISDRCNHACQHCYQLQGNKGELTTAEWISALEQMAREGVLFLTVSGGEATLRHDLIEILQAARRLGFAVRLFTNAYRVDDKLARSLAELHLLAIHVSVYSHLAEEHDAITGVPGSWLKTTEAIRMLTSLGAHVVVKWIGLSGCSSTEGDMQALAAEFHALLQSATMVTAREDGSTAASHHLMRSGEALVRLVGETSRAAPVSSAERLAQHPCGACRTSVAVLPNGSVRGCTGLEQEFGNVRRVRLLAADPQFQLLSQLRWRDLHGCRDCDLLPFCARCHADALRQSGDMMGPYVQACRLARATYASSVQKPELAAQGGELGPFRITSDGLLAVPDALTAADLALRAAHPWICAPRVQDPLARPCFGCYDTSGTK